MPTPRSDVLVIGAGVSGLSTAVCLAEAGPATVIRADHPPERTTSAAAGALWTPHLVEQGGRVLKWASRTFADLEYLSRDPDTGVGMVSGVQAARAPAAAPDWAAAVPGFRACRDDELPAGYVCGWRATLPLADMPSYLGYLLERFTSAGGLIEAGTFGSLAEAAGLAGAVVNCSGAGARRLVPDPLVTPVRGQVVIVRNPGIAEYFVDVSPGLAEPLYLLPHPDTVVLGGTEDRGSWDMRPDPQVARQIADRCAAVRPLLHDAEVVAHRVGLRPARPTVRLEVERLPGGTLLCHNYGHGGSGITVSWGCARDVTNLIIDGISGAAANSAIAP